MARRDLKILGGLAVLALVVGLGWCGLYSDRSVWTKGSAFGFTIGMTPAEARAVVMTRYPNSTVYGADVWMAPTQAMAKGNVLDNRSWEQVERTRSWLIDIRGRVFYAECIRLEFAEGRLTRIEHSAALFHLEGP